jgi:hypothetical protein
MHHTLSPSLRHSSTAHGHPHHRRLAANGALVQLGRAVGAPAPVAARHRGVRKATASWVWQSRRCTSSRRRGSTRERHAGPCRSGRRRATPWLLGAGCQPLLAPQIRNLCTGSSTRPGLLIAASERSLGGEAQAGRWRGRLDPAHTQRRPRRKRATTKHHEQDNTHRSRARLPAGRLSTHMIDQIVPFLLRLQTSEFRSRTCTSLVSSEL